MPPNSDITPSSGGTPPGTGKFSPREWDVVRTAFHTSIMIDTTLAGLAENLNVAAWPIKGEDETPAKYIDLTYRELCAMPGLAGKTERIDLLITILQETLAFDEPFGDMVTNDALVDERDNPILKNLNKLGIPEEFPISLIALTPETREFCNLEGITTLKAFAVFAQGISHNVILGGDFRALLNSLSHIDEQTLSQFFPFRPGEKGLHLLEGIALAVRAFPDAIEASLAQRYGAILGTEDAEKAESAQQSDADAAEEILRQHTASYIEYFQADHAKLQEQVNTGVPVARLAIVLKDPLVESIVTGLLKPYLVPLEQHSHPTTTITPTVQTAEPAGSKGGFFSKFGRLFKK
ncbi:hypothetical protein [Nibricoccus aquaticus]|nr:hypothetical protein [Nibricoccus aquaticus]